jgi:hypothetical protein
MLSVFSLKGENNESNRAEKENKAGLMKKLF